MLVNLWSTPRTGSNWYSQYLLQQYKSKNPRTILFKQYLNTFHFRNYTKPNFSDFLYEFERGSAYQHYTFDPLRRCITFVMKYEPRKLTEEDEERYRLELLEKHDPVRNPSIFYNHIAPMSKEAYDRLFEKADKNIFLYRKDFKRQLSSYALGYGTTEYKFKKDLPIYENVNVSYSVLKNLTDRVLLWHRLDKTTCEVIAYEDLDFTMTENLPRQQNKIDPYLQLDRETQDNILKLFEYYQSNL